MVYFCIDHIFIVLEEEKFMDVIAILEADCHFSFLNYILFPMHYY